MILLESEIRRLGATLFGAYYHPGRVQPASYDIAVNLFPTEVLTDEPLETPLQIGPLKRVLLSTIEVVSVPVDLAAEVRIRSTAARRGWICPPTLIDPGFMGHVTLELFNSSSQPLEITEEGLVQMVFFQGLGQTAGYDGRYQYQYKTTTAREAKS